MKHLLRIAACLFLSIGASADDAVDRLSKAVDQLEKQDGYALNHASWNVTVVNKEPTEGWVDAIVRQKDAALQVTGHYQDKSQTVYRKGDQIAALDENNAWQLLKGDKKADFLTRIFDLHWFLTQVRDIAVVGRGLAAETVGNQECWVVEIDADPKKLEKFLADTGNASLEFTLHDPKMTVTVSIGRNDGLVQRVALVLSGEARAEEIKDDGKDPGFKEWEPDDQENGDPNAKPKEKDKPKEPEKEAPKVEKVSITIMAAPNYKASLTMTPPLEVTNLIGLAN